MKKKMTIALAALLVLTMLAGCTATAAQDTQTGNPAAVVPENLDAEGVYQAMCQAVNGRVATSFTSQTQMGAKVSAMFMDMDASMTATTQVKLAQEPFAYHSATELEASFFGMDLNENIEVYFNTDASGLTSYFHLGDGDTWYRYQTALVPTDMLGQYRVTACTADWVPQGLTLQKVEDAYLLSCTYDAESALTAITSPFGELSLRDFDISGLSLAVTYWVDTETFLPSQIQIEYRGMSAVVADLFSKYAGKMMGGNAANFEADVQSYQETLSDLTYDAVEVPQVPQSALENSKDAKDFNFSDFMKKS